VTAETYYAMERPAAQWRPFELVVFDPTKIEESPWNRDSEWHGEFVAVNDLGLSMATGDWFPKDLGDDALALLRSDVRPKFAKFAEGSERSAYVERVLALTPGADEYEEYEKRSWRYLDDISGIAKLRDGRFVAWESPLDPSGTGFQPDAIGGGAEIMVAATAHAAWLSISEKARSEMRFATMPSEEALVNVLHDRYLELRTSRATTLASAIARGSDDPRREIAAIDARVYAELCARANESGEFGDLAHPRIMEMLARWDLHYDTEVV